LYSVAFAAQTHGYAGFGWGPPPRTSGGRSVGPLKKGRV